MSLTFHRIIAATDFSETASLALDRAAQLAARHGAELLLVHALERGSWIEDVAGEAASSGHKRAVFEAALAGLEQERARLLAILPAVHIEMVEQALHRALPDLLVANPSELLVMGAHGSGGWQDALMGSTADRVLRQHRLPVLLVRDGSKQSYSRVAIATDFSEVSTVAARFGLALTPGAVHLLLHAHEPPFDATLAFAGVSDSARESYRSESAQRAMTDLDDFAHKLGGTAVHAVPALREGRPSRVLTAFAAEADIDLMVLGVVGRSRLERGLLGSVTRHSASALACDVLVVPKPLA